ncbi:metallopeptidase family protein [Patescibacteria group bacterium]|nr:metallopeptidase family protein [Patescibacteria group bacterium]
MTYEEFEQLVVHALAQVPEKFARQMKNVAVLIEEGEDDGELLGLYQGVPQSERGGDYGIGMTLPDTITLYMRPIATEAAESGLSVEQVIQDTLWHEVGHYMGLDEDAVHKREDEGTNRYS